MPETNTRRTITADQLDFSPENSYAVISSAQKVVIPVPQFADGGEPLVYPQGHEKAGQAIADWQGKPIGEKGLVFFNGKDNSYQAVNGDGNGVVIINQVSESQAAALTQKINEFARDPSKLSTGQMQEVLRYAREDLGVVDMYNSDKGFISSKMTPIETAATGVESFGLHKRDDRDICRAVFVEGSGEFQGPAATPQKFENGAVIVKQGDSVRLVQPEIFQETYRQTSGEPVKLEAMPKGVQSVPHANVDVEAKPKTPVATADRPEPMSSARAEADAPSAKAQSHDHAAVGNHKFRSGGNIGAAVVDSVNLGQAVVKGDLQQAAAAGGSLATNTASAADDLLATAGKTSGNVAKVLGPVGIAATVATTGAELYKIQAEGGPDVKSRQGEAAATAAVGVGAGLGGMTLGAGVATALGAGGLIAGTIATGGTVLVAAAATAAVAYGSHKIDEKMYGAEDQRFQANLNGKQHMIALANGKFHEQLANPETGKVNLNDTATLNKLAVLLTREEDKQTQVMKDNSSYLPRWMRGSDSVVTQESARSDLNIAKAAKQELSQHFNDRAQSAKAHAVENALHLARQEKAIATRAGISGGTNHSEAKAIAPSQVAKAESPTAGQSTYR